MATEERMATDFNKRLEVARDAMSGAQAGSLHRNAAMMDTAQTTQRFDELSIEQKIERLADSLRLVAGQQIILGEVAQEAKNVAEFHEHHPTGQKFVPLHAANQVRGHLGQRWHDGPMKRVLELLR